MTLPTTNTATPRIRRNLDTVLPEVMRRVHGAEFATQRDLAAAYGVDEATVTYWKRRAFEGGLTDPRAWTRSLTLGRLTKLAAA